MTLEASAQVKSSQITNQQREAGGEKKERRRRQQEACKGLRKKKVDFSCHIIQSTFVSVSYHPVDGLMHKHPHTHSVLCGVQNMVLCRNCNEKGPPLAFAFASASSGGEGSQADIQAYPATDVCLVCLSVCLSVCSRHSSHRSYSPAVRPR